MPFLFFLSFLFFAGEVLAESLLKSSSCLIGKNATANDIKEISTVGSLCFNKCDTFCKKKFRLNKEPKIEGKNQKEIIELKQKFTTIKNRMIEANKDKIEDCLASCYKGIPYQGTIRVPILLDYTGRPENDPQKPYPWACEIDASKAPDNLLDLNCNNLSNNQAKDEESLVCGPDELADNLLDSSQNLLAGDKLIVSLGTAPSKEQTNLLEINNNLYLCGFKTKFFTPQYVNNKGEEVDQGNFFHQIPLQTSFEVRDGDFLQIAYFGRYYSSCPQGNCQLKEQDYDLKINFSDIVLPITTLDRTQSDEIASSKCDICRTNPENAICKNNYCQIIINQKLANGLTRLLSYNNNPEIFLEQFNKNYDSNRQFRYNLIFGSLTGLGKISKDLILSYPSFSNSSRGGYFTAVTWRGCNYKEGERLEYLIINSDLKKSEDFDFYIKKAPWQDLKLDPTSLSASLEVKESDLLIPADFNQNNFTVSSKPTATILFRIKGLTDEEVKSLAIKDFSKELALGSYYLKFQPSSSGNLAAGILDRLLSEQILTFPDKFFQFIIKNSSYISFIKALLVAYLAFTAISFMIGTVQITQTEGIMRVFKISIVLALISDTSFEFFSSHFLQAFTLDSMNNLANLITPRIEVNWGAGVTSDNSCFTDPQVKVKLLCLMSKDFMMLGNWTLWQRIIGMVFTGLFLPAIAIIISLFLYLFVILKVTFMYFVGVILMIITITLAPFFIPFILFKYTKGFFDGWVKQLIVLMIQPLLIFTSISLFRLLFLQIVQLLFGINACKICLLNLFGWCPEWLNVYVAVNAAAIGTGGSIFILSNLLALLIIGYGMNTFYLFAAGLSSRLINWLSTNLSHNNLGTLELAGKASSLYSTISKPSELLAIDDQSYKERATRRKNEIEKNKEGK
jgi:type IV secretory pathway VirB6-like protein